MQKKITKPTKKQLIIIAGVAVIVLVLLAIGWWLIKRLEDTPALKIGDKVIYTRDYHSFIKQAEGAGFTKKDARSLLIDYYRLQEAARVANFPVSHEYAENRRAFYKAQDSKMTDAVARAQAYRSAVQRAIDLQGIEGVEARLIRLPFQTTPGQYGLPTKQEAKKLIEAARTAIVERRSDEGIDAIREQYPSLGVVNESIFTYDGLMTGQDGRTIYKPIPILKDDIKQYIANCKQTAICGVQEVAYSGTFFFMHILDRLKNVTGAQVRSFERAGEQVRVVEYIDED